MWVRGSKWINASLCRYAKSRAPCGRVGLNANSKINNSPITCRALCGRVGLNEQKILLAAISQMVAPRVGAWVEIRHCHATIESNCRALCGCVGLNISTQVISNYHVGRALYGRVGLNDFYIIVNDNTAKVAPCAGVWV